jgi:paraquat-inducible protein A
VSSEPDSLIIAVDLPREAWRLRVLVVLAGVLLAVGVVSPIITLEKFLVVENTFSVLTGVLQLLEQGQYFLFLVIAAFSVGLPAVKLSLLFRLVSTRVAERERRYLHWLHVYGKWSMLDVFVVAVLVVAVKLGALAEVTMRYGLYAFAASVLLTMVVTGRIASLSARHSRSS